MKRSNVMCLDLKKDIRTLLVDTEIFQEDLEMTEREYCNWVRERKINDLAKITEYLKKLESEVIIMEIDCITLMGQTYQNHSTWQNFNRFHLTFLTLYNLLNELKKIRTLLGCTLIFPDQMKQLDTYWGGFRKPINRIQKDLITGETFRMYTKALTSNEDIKGI